MIRRLKDRRDKEKNQAIPESHESRFRQVEGNILSES